jgi:hypothetical protein
MAEINFHNENYFIKRKNMNELYEDTDINHVEFYRFMGDYEPPKGQWLIPDLVCNSLTVLSGEPKSGKTLLAGHLVQSLILKKDILGKSPSQQTSRVGWIGFDANWQFEVQMRLPEIPGNGIVFFDAPNGYSSSKGWGWETIAQKCVELGVSLVVVDHLYGLSDTLNLDHAWEMANALKKIRIFYKEFNIPTLLIAQAGKGANGRAAHSVQLEGEARHLLQLDGKGVTGIRKLKVLSNISQSQSFKINLTPDNCEFSSSATPESASSPRRRVESNLPEIARNLLTKSEAEDLKSASALARFDAANKISGRSGAKSCRTSINHLIKSKLLARDPINKAIIAGPQLIDSSELN